MIALRVFGSVLHFLLKGGTVTGAMIAGTVIGSLPRMVRYFGESVLTGMKGLLAKI